MNSPVERKSLKRKSKGKARKRRKSEDMSLLLSDVGDDRARSQKLVEIREMETCKVFLYKPRDRLMQTHLMHAKAQNCSPLQNLRFLQDYGFSFKLEFHGLRSGFVREFPDHNCRITISAYLNEVKFNDYKGVGYADFVVLAREIAAAEVCEQIELWLETKLAPYNISEALRVRPGIVQELESVCKDRYASPAYKERKHDDKPAHQRHGCTVKVGLGTEEAFAYHPDVARFLAAKKIYETITQTANPVKILNSDSSLPESEEKYIPIIDRVLDLEDVPFPNKNLIPPTTRKALGQKLQDYFQHLSTTRSHEAASEVLPEAIPEVLHPAEVSPEVLEVREATSTVEDSSPQKSSGKKIPSLMSLVLQISENDPDRTLTFTNTSENNPENQPSSTSSLSPADSDSESPGIKPKLTQSPKLEKASETEEQKKSRNAANFPVPVFPAGKNEESDESSGSSMNGTDHTETSSEDPTITPKESSAVRNMATDVSSDIFTSHPATEQRSNYLKTLGFIWWIIIGFLLCFLAVYVGLRQERSE